MWWGILLQAPFGVKCDLPSVAGIERHSESKPHFVSPIFKCMESQSMHVIEIIQTGYNPKERPEPIFWYQPSRSFGVSLASSNLVMCPSTQMHIYRCVVGFRASFMPSDSSRSQRLFLWSWNWFEGCTSCRTSIAGAHHHEFGLSEEQFKHVCWASSALWEGAEVYCCLHLPLLDY